MGSFRAWKRAFSSSSLSAFISASCSLMAATLGCNFFTSRSCLVPMKRATTLSRICAGSMNGFVCLLVFERAGARTGGRDTGVTVYSNCLDARAPNGEQERGQRHRGRSEGYDRLMQHAAPRQTDATDRSCQAGVQQCCTLTRGVHASAKPEG